MIYEVFVDKKGGAKMLVIIWDLFNLVNLKNSSYRWKIRSKPFSKYCTSFNTKVLSQRQSEQL